MSSIAAALGLPSLNDPQSSNDPHSPKDSEENSDEPLPGLTTLTQLDEEDDDEEGEEEDQQQEAQMLLIMKQIELQKRKNDKKQQLKYEKSAAEQVTTQFKNALAKDSSASQKRYRDEADVVNRELEELSAEHVEWEARRKKFHEEVRSFVHSRSFDDHVQEHAGVTNNFSVVSLPLPNPRKMRSLRCCSGTS